MLNKTMSNIRDSRLANFFQKLSIVKLLLILSIIVIATFALRIITVEAEINFESTYNLPVLNSLSDFPALDYGQWAVAIDEKIIKQSSDELSVTPTASTAKMILALAVMEQKPFNLGEAGETITISSEYYNRYLWYIANGGSNTKVELGEEISQYDALASTMLASSNNMADTLAIWAFGSLEAYRDYASNMLSGWGITNTKIGNDASGFSETSASTASDLALVGQKVLENPVLAEIVKTQKYTVPVAGELTNSNRLLGELGIIGIKTGWIGDISGYQLVTGYRVADDLSANDRTITLALLGAPTRADSFTDSRQLISDLQERLVDEELIKQDEIVGYINSWWTGRVPVRAKTSISALTWENMETDIKTDVAFNESVIGGDQPIGKMQLKLASHNYETELISDQIQTSPSIWQRFLHLFGWHYQREDIATEKPNEDRITEEPATDEIVLTSEGENPAEEPVENPTSVNEKPEQSVSDNPLAGNCTTSFGSLMLINPNFTVSTDFIATRKTQLISISKTYGIPEYNPNNGDNLLDTEAASHLNDMLKAYSEAYPGHSMGTRSCFRQKGTNCGRLCAATGTSDHHTGYTCDLIDNAYGTTLDTDHYSNHIEWQWLKQNSYKYGFIDRFPIAWAGGSMSEPLNVDANGSTGLYETWHYRYVGITAATEIATGKYNNGAYDSLEHYLLATKRVQSLNPASCN